MVETGGSGRGSGSGIEGASGWDSELVPNGSPKLNNEDKLTVPLSVVGEPIGDSGNGVCVGEGSVASVPGNGVGGFEDTGVLVAFVGVFDASPIPKDREARSLSSNRDRGLLGSYAPLAVPLVPAWAGLDERCACNDLRMLEIAESARWLEDGTPPSEVERDITFGVSLS